MVPFGPASWNAAARSGVAYQSIWIATVAGQMPANEPLVAVGAGVSAAPQPARLVLTARRVAPAANSDRRVGVRMRISLKEPLRGMGNGCGDVATPTCRAGRTPRTAAARPGRTGTG